MRGLDRHAAFFAAAAVLLLAGRETYESLNKPLFGFHSSYVNAYEEGGFIRDHYAGLRMGNDYGNGSYLLWALWPGTKVFIDARYFPYMSWYGEYVDFVRGRNVEAFLKKYPCDLWCLSYEFPGVGYFAKSPDWKLAHYGPSACVFVRKGIPVPDEKRRANVGENDLAAYQALKILQFALGVGDVDTAGRIAAAMKVSRWSSTGRPLVFQAHVDMGSVLARLGRRDEAVAELGRALLIKPDKPELITKMGDLYRAKGDLARARERYLKALEIDPKSFTALLNMSVACSLQGRYDEALAYLDKALAVRPGSPDAYYNMSCVYARRNDADLSVKYLSAAVANGFNDWKLVKSDPDLAPIRGTKAYQDLVKGR